MDSPEERLSRLDRYIDDELDHDERMDFESRLADSPELSRELAERRAAMGMLADWSDSLVGPPARRRLTLGASLRLALAAAAAVALVAVPLALSRRPDARGADAGGLTWGTMDGVRLVETGDAATEMVVDPFPMKWRTLSDGVQVIDGESGGPDELVVDPFPEEGK
ncbi:MAG: anti-sigma factor family protein [Planctomycetota bacterium]